MFIVICGALLDLYSVGLKETFLLFAGLTAEIR